MRIQNTAFFLTYPQCNLTHEDIKQGLYSKQIPRFTIDQYLIAKEDHADGGKHFHVYLKLQKKFNCNDERWFDIEGFHPNIQACRSPKDVIMYVTKDNDYIKSDNLSIEIKGHWSDMDKDITTVKEFMANVKKYFPKEYWNNYERIKSAAEHHFKTDTVAEPQHLPAPAITTPTMDHWVDTELKSVN